MNPKQESFCQEYVIDSNATQAAIRAGYSPKTAYSQGQRLLKKVEVRTRVDELFAEHRERIDVTVDSLTDLLIGDRKLAHDNKQAGAAVSASEKLAKLHGFMSERLKVDVNVTTGEMSDAELEAELDEIERDNVRREGRPWIEGQIAYFQRKLDEFDNGKFDTLVAPRAALPAPVLQNGPSEE